MRPTHPGGMLREDFLADYGLSATQLAGALGVSRQTVNELLRERRSVSAEMALRLARLFGNSPGYRPCSHSAMPGAVNALTRDGGEALDAN